MTAAEKAVVHALGEAWNLYLTLPKEHADDDREFRQGIHQLQDKILARPARRKINKGRTS